MEFMPTTFVRSPVRFRKQDRLLNQTIFVRVRTRNLLSPAGFASPTCWTTAWNMPNPPSPLQILWGISDRRAPGSVWLAVHLREADRGDGRGASCGFGIPISVSPTGRSSSILGSTAKSVTRNGRSTSLATNGTNWRWFRGIPAIWLAAGKIVCGGGLIPHWRASSPVSLEDKPGSDYHPRPYRAR